MNALTVGGLFDGAGLLALGLHQAGLRHAWMCEADEWRRELLTKRFPGIPVYPDVRGVGAATAVRVDVIAGGFPCKGASTAGKRNGFDHAETVLWHEMRRAVGELQPRYVLIENVADILKVARFPGEPAGSLWSEVLADLAALGFDAEWDCFPAASFGAPHLRDRLICIATNAAGASNGENAGTACGGASEDRAAARGPASRSRPVADTASERAPHEGGDSGGGHHEGREPAVSDREAAADAESGRHAASVTTAERDGREAASTAKRHGPAPADAARDAEGRPSAAAGTDREQARACAGVAVEWGEYQPAITRWEAIHGPAPQPLIRRMDARLPGGLDRSDRRVDRRRLSALGDGVQVQLGVLAGRAILHHAEHGKWGRLTA